MITLNVNIDHVATLRNARGGFEPSPLEAAIIAEKAGANGIVLHLREDRRHIKDNDVLEISMNTKIKLDLEMSIAPDIVDFALKLMPPLITLVPEKRAELTTEGGLDVVKYFDEIFSITKEMKLRNTEVSLFVEPNYHQIKASKDLGADMVEIHTGTYANLTNSNDFETELLVIEHAIKYANSLGLKVAAGHGLNYSNTQAIAKLKGINELSIGHSIISRSVFVGLENAIKEMITLIKSNEN
ncbi:MAG: pyridoxine 5'-phosphate synthase [Candidatus Kapabacteria bacterium]|nr:pyridoxine 5'-phosphate synthase [Candidatus Kapabacteria bacterium]